MTACGGAAPRAAVTVPARLYITLEMDVISSAASTTPSLAAGSAHVRVPGDFKELYSRFLIRNPSYALQYCHIYQKRLALLRPLVLETARLRWPAVNGRREFSVSFFQVVQL
jgi:hypothetical protein